MTNLIRYIKSQTKLELIKVGLDVFECTSGRVGVDFIIKSKSGKFHEIYLVPINLDKERSVKISKEKLGDLNDNLWIGLVFVMENLEPILYLIPSKRLAQSDNIFINNEQSERFKYYSNWEIKVFIKAIPELSKFALDNMTIYLE